MEKQAEAVGPTGERVRYRLRKLRLEQGLTLRELADRLRELGRPIVLSSISKIEKGQRRVDVDDLVALALALQVSPDQILLPDDLEHGDVVHLTPTFSLSVPDAHTWASRESQPNTGADLDSVAKILDVAKLLRTQIAALHSHMRLPHLGVSRAVPNQHLYVEPVLQGNNSDTHQPASLTALNHRSVVLGDPGAGKSTLLTKIAHDLATSPLPDHKAQVPFVLTVREFTESIRTGNNGLVDYLKQACRNPYNIEPPEGAVEYLLRNARAVVLIDGFDELTEVELRRKFVRLVDSFITQYPQVPIVVTSRRTGYSDAPMDSRKFAVSSIASLNNEQIHQYVKQWFALDESSPPAEREKLAESLLIDSEDVRELRTNPLILSMLCAMYSSDRYLPRNRAQVYERCALMLFNTWDSRRGIAMPMQFHGRLRSAVQHLGWRVLTMPNSEGTLSRHRIIQIMSEHLTARQFDEDEAETAAEQFVQFCTGRAWVLTDAGSSATGEPLFAFTHRTFLEYFAAEYLVRQARTAGQLWEKLAPQVMAGNWETVAQITVQLYDRNVEAGADELVHQALSEQPVDEQSRSALRNFIGQVLDSNHLSPRVLARAKSILHSGNE